MFDRQDIYDCLTRLSQGADRLVRALFVSAFHTDAVIDVANFVGGPDALYDWAAKVGENRPIEHHYLLNHACDLDGDTAHTETYFLYTAKLPDDATMVAGGRYIDRFERRDGVWAIAFRYNMIEWGGALDPMAAPFADMADLRANGTPQRGRDDPAFRRPLTNLRMAPE